MTLDLAGHDLTANYVTAFDSAHIIDSLSNNGSVAGGVLKIGKSKLVLDNDNKQIPVWNGVDGYVFSSIAYSETGSMGLTIDATNDTAYLKFIPWFDYVDENYVMNDADDAGVQVLVRMAWTVLNSDGTVNGTAYQNFVFDDGMVEMVVKAGGKKALQLTLSNISSKQGLTMTPIVVSETTHAEVAGRTINVN